MINILLEHAKKIKDFSVLAPKIKNFKYGDELYIEKNIDKKYHKMKYIIGAALLFDMKSLEKTGYFDENIFMYYEEVDFYFRCLKVGLDIYLIDDAKLVHHGASSTNQNYKHEITLNRNWHYCWSKFYHYKKNYSYLYGLRKTYFNFLRSFVTYLIYFTLRNKKASLHMAEMQGFMTSYFLRKSYRRPKINI